MARLAHLVHLVVVAAVVMAFAALVGPAPGTAAGPGFAGTPVFGSGGMAQAVFGGGNVEDLEAAALGAGATGVWVQATDGSFHLLVVGGPAFLKDEFRARFAGGIGVTAVTLSRPEGAASAPPASAPVAPAAPAVPAPATPAPARSGAPGVVAAPDALPTPPLPGRGIPTPSPLLTYPAPIAGSGSSATGVPSPLIEFHGAMRADSAARFAFDFTAIDTLPALRAGASTDAQQVTLVRMCRAVLDQPEECLDAAAPPVITVRPGPERYFIAVPPPGSSAVVTAQFCNPRGCGDKTVVGVAAVTADGTMYSIGSAYAGASRVRTYRMDTRLLRVRWAYSDGLAAYYGECAIDDCPGSDRDLSLAPFAIVDGIGVVGTPLVTTRLLIRGTITELLRQQLDPAPRRAAAASGTAPQITTTSTIEDGGLTARVGSLQTYVVSPADQEHEAVAPYLAGGSVVLRLPAHSLPDRAMAMLALIDVADLASRASAPAGTEFVAALHLRAGLTARSLDGFERQVLIDVRLDRSALPPDTSVRDLSMVRWDGSAWVPASDSVVVRSDGALNPQLWTQANGFYAVVRAVRAAS